MRRYTVEIAGRTVTVEVDGATVRLEGRVVEGRVGGARGDVRRRVQVDGRSREFVVVGGPCSQWRLSTCGHRFDAVVLDERARAVRAAGGGALPASGTLKAPMPGMVVRVLVAPGQVVEKGTALVVVEAMKMENELRAAGAGLVRRVLVAPGDAVEKGALLVEMGPGAR